MKLETLNEKNEVIETITNDNLYIMEVLLKQLWLKQMQVTKDITKIKYNYNYSDRQVVTIYFKNKMKYKFIDIPTKGGCIDTETILKGGE